MAHNISNLADIRIDKKWNFKKVALDVFLELQNAFASQTPQPPQFGLNRDEAGNLISPEELVEIPQEGGSVIPVLGFVVDFRGLTSGLELCRR